MTKFHVNDEGRALSCEASVQNCRFSDNVGHHNTEAEARQAYEEKQESQVSNSLKKNATTSKQETFEDVKNTLTEEDMEYGLQRVMRFVSSEEGKRWNNIMGDKRQSKNNLKEYDDFLKAEVNADEELLSKVKEQAAENARRFSYARAYQKGVSIDPEMEKELEQQWNNDGYGFSEKQTEEELVRIKRTKESFERGATSPARIVGSGYKNPPKVAREYLKYRVEELELSLKTRGRSNGINVSNAIHRLKTAENNQ